jgi:hypothetical protein
VTTKKTMLVLAIVVLAVALALVAGAGCTTDSGNGESNGGSQNGDSGGDGGSDNGDAGNGSDDMSQAEMEEEAVRTAKAWFVAKTDFTSDQFDFAVEGFAQADDGSYYARVSATPKDGSMDAEQIYVEKPSDMELWYPIDMGTGIDPAMDERFPEEVGDQLQP